MAEYYYTVASLPMLTPGQESPISLEYFLDNCSYTLSANDYEVILSAELIPRKESSNQAIAMWQNWERSLRNELAVFRGQKTGIEYEKYLQDGPSSTGVSDAVKEANSAVNPKIGEEILDNARWRFLDEIESSHYFDLTKLIVYYLKLQIAERKKIMNQIDGEENYQKIYQGITEKIHQSYDGEL